MIETTYRGYRIHYSENEDVWRCSDLNAEAVTLTALKQKMSRLILKARKESGAGIPALHLGHSKVYEPVEIVGRAGVGWDRKTPSVWYMGPGTDGKVTRQKAMITDFVAPTAEDTAALEVVVKIDEEISKLSTERFERLRVITRLIEADIAALVPDED